MSFKETHIACADCGSSDARCIYESGVSICFSCGVRKAPEGTEAGPGPSQAPFVIGEPVRLGKRGITLETCKRYGYIVGDAGTEKVQAAPYYNPTTGALVAQKIRTATKQFSIRGNGKGMPLWGLQLGRAGGKMIVITEGELDAMSVSQAMGNTWPVVSLPAGAGSLDAIKSSLEFLESYDKVVLAFDNDEPGHKATVDVLELLSAGKGYTAALGDYKDPNDMLVQGSASALRSTIWEAKQYRPDGIINMVDARERIMAPISTGLAYPWAGLQSMTHGHRAGDLTTWTAGTGTGKSAAVSEVVYDLLVSQGLKVGIVYLEEGVARSGRRLMGIHLNMPIHIPGVETSAENMEAAFEATAGTNRLFAYDHFGSIDAEVLTSRMRYLRVAMGCDAIVLDHVSIVVSGGSAVSDERKDLDRIVTHLKSMAVETGVSIHIVSHLKRKGGDESHEEGGQVSLADLRGTQAIAQLSDTVIALERDQQAEGAASDLTNVRVLKNRLTGETGTCDKLVYNRITGRLKSVGADKAVSVTTIMANSDF